MHKTRIGVDSKCTLSAKDSDELSVFKIIYLMPPADQSVLINDGLELSYRRRRGEVIMLSVNFSNNVISGGYQASIG